jgi:hypothetical protein
MHVIWSSPRYPFHSLSALLRGCNLKFNYLDLFVSQLMGAEGGRGGNFGWGCDRRAIVLTVYTTLQ